MSHSPNYGLATDMKGPVIDALRVTGLNVANGQLCTIAEDCGGGYVTSVTHTGTGIYTLQLSPNYYPKLINAQAELSCANATAVVLQARYQSASYNATTGQAIFNITNTANSATDGGATDELHIVLILRRYTANP